MTNNIFHSSMKVSNMKRLVSFLALVVAALAPAAGCNDGLDPIDRVQTNLVDKSIFEGEWWFTQTYIDVNGEEALTGVFDNYPVADWGSVAYHPIERPWAGNYPLGRIRWVIDENTLFAFRSYELIDGGNDDGRDPNFRGQPLAAYRIVNHVDVRQDYDPITGELTNVRVEDTSDRQWYDRRFMRVDWSVNLISTPFIGADQGGAPPYDIEPLAHPELPKAWEPSFVRIGQDPEYRFADEWADADAETIHYMSFVTQSLYSPVLGGCSVWVGGGPAPCTTMNLTVRSSFLRVPPNHSYAGETLSHREFDRFGVIRGAQRTYVRGGTAEGNIANYCSADADCGIGGYCDVEQNVCLGGLTSDYGETDFMTFYRSRHNFWQRSLTDTACLADWQCDDRYGTGGTVGSVCDRAARKCTIPLADRAIREVVYTLNPGFPAYLTPSAFETVGIWNEAFMRGWRAVKGVAAPTGPNQACQETDPTAYCFCGSPDDIGDRTCRYRYDPFMSPADATAAGVVNPYDCYVQNTAGFTRPLHPTSEADYPGPDVYQYDFVGEECMLVLESNRCDRAPGEACQELGDIRYQFFNYIEHGNVYFGGVATPMVDPINGEFIYSSINMAAESIESVGTTAREFYPVLRDEPGANDRYFGGEDVRGYYGARGNVERPPTAVGASSFDGFTIPDDSRPGMPLDMAGSIRDYIDANQERFERLRGAEGRTQIMSDRLSRLAGSPIESRLMGAVGQEIAAETLDFSQYDSFSLSNEAVLDQISPFRNGAGFGAHRDWHRVEQRYPSGIFVDPPYAPEIESSRSIYWAQKFAGYPVEEAGIRMQQAYMRGVMLHEMGHGIGLEHNFGGSLDRDQYDDGYFNQVFRDGDALAIPTLIQFDRPNARCDGAPCPGNANGTADGEEVNNYYRELRRVRNERNRLGISPHTSSSVMDYHGENSRALPDLGRYDIAAALYNHFDLVEVYDENPEYESGSSLNGIHQSATTPRLLLTSYRGGDACTETSQCPYSAARTGQLIGQTCILNPRQSRVPLPCVDPETGGPAQNCVCSSFDEDMITEASDSFPDAYPVNYLSCTNFRLNDISWCTWFDAGESFQEVIDNYRRGWEQSYPLAYYRRFRRSGPTSGGAWQSIQDSVKIYQHFLFRYFNEPDFRSDEGALGVTDQLQACGDTMNWLAEIITLPQEGSYQLDPSTNSYRRLGEDMGMPGSDISLPVGMGYPMWSQYEEGLQGFFRTARSGVFFDKYLALYALAVRDWGLSYSLDDRYYINFYDLYSIEMNELFGGLILNDPSWFAPRVQIVDGEPRVLPLTWDRGMVFGACRQAGVVVPCRPDQQTVYPEPSIRDTSNEVLRDWATILALAQFPVFYDASFEQRLSVFKFGTGDGFRLADIGPDGQPICGYERALPDTGHPVCTDPDEADYVAYESDRLHQLFVAMKVNARLEYNLPEEQIGFRFLLELTEKQDEVRTLRALPSPTAAQLERLRQREQELNAGESFLEYLIDVQREYGISAYFL
jgi:hypothetical protein